jgi:hypothetical protein
MGGGMGGAGMPAFRKGGAVSKAALAKYENSARDKREDRAGARAMSKGK